MRLFNCAEKKRQRYPAVGSPRMCRNLRDAAQRIALSLRKYLRGRWNELQVYDSASGEGFWEAVQIIEGLPYLEAFDGNEDERNVKKSVVLTIAVRGIDSVDAFQLQRHEMELSSLLRDDARAADSYVISGIYIKCEGICRHIHTSAESSSQVSGANARRAVDHLIAGVTIAIPSGVPFPSNMQSAEGIYTRLHEMLFLQNSSESKTCSLLDVHCGSGVCSIVLSPHLVRCVGFDCDEDAISFAKTNACRNKADNCEFLCGDVGNSLAVYLKDTDSRSDAHFVAIATLPASGMHADVIEALAGDLRIRRALFISDALNTLIRTASKMQELGFKAEKAWGFDTHPHTTLAHCALLMSNGFK